MKSLTFQVSDDLYEAFQQIASKSGRMVEDVALDWLAKHTRKPRPPLTDEASQEAWQRLRRYAGAMESGDPRSADNERIDADLVAEHGKTHEEER